MDTQFINYPLQKLSFAKKDKDWRQANMEFFINKSMIGMYGGMTRYEKILRNYNLYNGKINRKDFEYVTNPYGIDQEDALPANLKNINILRTAIDLLIGEETKRPFNAYVFQTNPNVLSSKLQEQDEQLKQILEGIVVQQLIQKFGPQAMQDQDPKAQQQIQEQESLMMNQMLKNHLEHDPKDELEEAVNHYVKWAIQKFQLKDLYINCWKDGLISAMEIALIGTINGKPYPERVNPAYFDCDKNPDLYFIEKGNWAVRKMFMDPTSIIDNFGDILEEEDKNSIMEGYPYSSTHNTGSDVNYNYIRRSYDSFDPNQDFLSNQVPVWHACWRSYVKIGYLKFTDPMTGQVVEDIVSEDYQKREGDEIVWDWITEVWEGYRIGNNIYAGINPTDYEDLPYVGIIHNNDNSEASSLVDIMFPLLVTYIITWYRLELTMARDKGKVINIDITQIPKSLGFDFKLWAHYLSMLQVNLINPYEEGWEVKRGGHAAGFNQFSSVDLTMANVMNEYIMLLNKIEELIGKISGVTEQRKGSITNYELVSNVERSVTQSSHITEPWFYRHNRFKENVLKALVVRGQQLWKGQEETLSYIMDDMTRQIFTMPWDFDLADLDIFISDSTSEARKLEALRSLSQPALQAGASLYEAGNMFITDSATEILNKLKEIDERKKESDQQNAKAQQEAMTQQAQMESEDKQKDRDADQKREELKAKTAVTVALIHEEGKKALTEQGIDPSMSEGEIEKLSLDREKLNKDTELRTNELEEKKRSNKAKEKKAITVK